MELEPPKSARPTSNPAGFLQRFTKLCKLRSVGIPSGGIPIAGLCNEEDCSTDDTDCSEENRNRKIHPQPCEDTPSAVTGEPAGLVISKLFELVSSLKTAYVQLQQAHIPYDPDKIRSADQLVVSKLESLSEVEHSYLEDQHSKPKTLCALEAEIEAQHCLLEKLQARAQKKDTEILQLRWQLEELDLKNAEMEEQIKCKAALHDEIVPLHQHLNPSAFSIVFESAAKSIHDFAKPLIALMKASGWDLDRAAGSIAGPVAYAERSHKKYAFEAYLSWKLFRGDQKEDCLRKGSVDSVMRFEDAFEALVEDPDSSFARFCRRKYLAMVHPRMEESFFGNLDQRAFVSGGGGHPRTPLYRAFAKMARWVWVLRVMAAAIAPRAEAFYAPRRCGFSEKHMESVVEVEGEVKLWRVGLTVMPGFRVGESVAKCRVYLTRERSTAMVAPSSREL